VAVLAVNLVGDTTNAVMRGDLRTLIGLPIGGALKVSRPDSAVALVAFAFDTPLVELVRAQRLPAANALTRVLAKCGFHYVGTVVDPDDGPVWR
jgi:hypothetical protein